MPYLAEHFGSFGIGASLAVLYAKAGCDSVISYIEADGHDPQLVVKAVEAEGRRCIAVPCDVSSAADVEKFAQTALDEFGRIDIAVAMAGILRRAPLEDMTDERFNDMLDIDLVGVLRLFRSAAARMIDGGAMVAASSIAGGHYGWEEHVHYAAAKSGLQRLCRSLAVELAPRQIRVNTIIPGLIESPQSLDGNNSLGKDGLDAASSYIPWDGLAPPKNAHARFASSPPMTQRLSPASKLLLTADKPCVGLARPLS